MEFNRRSFIATSGQALGAGWLALDWPKIATAADHAHVEAQSGRPKSFAILNAEMARDVDAMCAQIIPSDDSPGARAAGAMYSIDQALGGFYAPHRTGFLTDYAEFAAGVSKRFTGARFANIPIEQGRD
jgi:hypothetical protein